MKRTLFSINSYNRLEDTRVLTALLKHYYPQAIIHHATSNNTGIANEFNVPGTDWFDVVRNAGHHGGVAEAFNSLMKYDLEQFDWIWSLHCDTLPYDMDVFSTITDFLDENGYDVGATTGGDPIGGCMHDNKFMGYFCNFFVVKPHIFRSILPMDTDLDGVMWVEVRVREFLDKFGKVYDIPCKSIDRLREDIFTGVMGTNMSIGCGHNLDHKLSKMSEEMYGIIKEYYGRHCCG